MMHVNSWLLKIQCFDFLFWYNRDYSKGFYSPWLKNQPCSTEQRVNIEILPVPNFDLESMESRMTHCEMGIDQNMFLYQITIFHWSHILTGRYSGILRAKTKGSLNSCVFPPSNAQLPWRVSAGLLENAKRTFRGHFCDFIGRSFLKVMSHPFIQWTPDLWTVLALEIRWGDLALYYNNSSQSSVCWGTELFQLHNLRRALVDCPSILVLGIF